MKALITSQIAATRSILGKLSKLVAGHEHVGGKGGHAVSAALASVNQKLHAALSQDIAGTAADDDEPRPAA